MEKEMNTDAKGTEGQSVHYSAFISYRHLPLQFDRGTSALPDTAAVQFAGIACDGTAVQRQRSVVAKATSAFLFGRVTADGNIRERCRGAIVVKETATTEFFTVFVIAGVIGDSSARHGKRTMVRDSATPVFGMVARDNDIRQFNGGIGFDIQSTAIAAIAAG